MIKFIVFATVALSVSANASICSADYKDLKDKVETVANVWVGGYLQNADSSVSNSRAEDDSLSEAADRVGSQKAAEFSSLKNSVSGGFYIKAAPAPSRLHLEFDYYNEHEWFGDLRYSFKDYLQIRLLPRRFVHNLDKLTVFDFNPASSNNPGSNDVDNQDASIDDYGLRMDIDEYKLRLKIPNYPLHVYSNGEIIKKTGTRQSRFLGGDAYFSTGFGRVRVAQSRDIDQAKQEISVGSNAHLGPIEIDFSHRSRKFKADEDVAAPEYPYNFGYQTVHNVIPELKAMTNTVKIHTSHTGRVFAAATFTKTDKTNEYSGAEAENTLSYGQIYWLPTAYLALSSKYRRLKNKAEAPTSWNEYGVHVAYTPAPVYTFGLQTYSVHPGVESQTDTLTVNARYSLIPSTNLSLQYIKKIKEVEDQSAIDWSRPLKTTKDIYQVGLTNWAIPKVRITAKFIHTNIGTDFGHDIVGLEPVNNDPEQTNQGNLGITWMMSSRVAAYFSANVAKDETDDNRMIGGISDANIAEALREQYLASISFVVSERFTISSTYAYMSDKQERDIVWEDLNDRSSHWVDHDYSIEQKAQNFALNMMFAASKRLHFNGSVDYTITEGSYDPTSPITMTFDFYTDEIGQLAESSTKELNVRLDTDFDLGRGWGIGVDLRYTDWQDESFDNPSDGTFISGLMKISKEMQSH